MDNDNFIKELGRSYIVSSLLPAAFFCLIMLLLFRNFIPPEFQKQVEEADVISLIQWMLMGIVPVWIGFFLFSSVDWVVRFFEGYFLPYPIKEILTEAKRKELNRMTKDFQEIKNILNKDITDRDGDLYNEKIFAATAELRSIEINMPLDDTHIMPTRLGNVLKASEAYAQIRYSIESVNVWPRLFAVLPQQFLKDMEEKNNHFMFLLNSSFLFLVAGFLSMTTFFILESQYFLPLLSGSRSYILKYDYFIFSTILFSFGYVLYRVAVNAARDFAFFYRAGFDLYRIDLLSKLYRERPKSLREEKNLWLDISDFLAFGDQIEWDADNSEPPSYVYNDTAPNQTEQNCPVKPFPL